MLKTKLENYKAIALKVILLLVFLELQRMVFFITYPRTAGSNLFLDLLYGLRFDISAICILLAPWFIILTFPGFYNSRKKWTDYYFYLILFVCTLLNLIDTAWFEYTGKRTTSDVFSLLSLGNDINNNLSNYLLHYWYLLIMMILILFVGVLSVNKINQKVFISEERNQPGIILQIILFIGINGIVFIGIRGGTQMRPISIQNAITGVNPNEVPLILNTPFTILKSWRDDPIPSIKYMDDNAAKQIFDFNKTNKDTVSFQKLNVVVLVMESFSKHLIGSFTNSESFTPFLDSLATESLICTNAYANGKRSIEGIPAVISSIPHLTDEPFITGAYNVNRINSLASILGKEGYQSAFFHGGHNGTMGFDNFSKVAGYQKYYGSNEYKGLPSDDDGHWGIYDHAFLKFMLEKINGMQKPFHAAYFSLSSHDPYTIPSQFQKKFPKGKESYQQSIRYADYSLSLFFEMASKQEWFKNTLFIIVADHTGPSNGEYYTNSAGQLAIPILYYCPALNLKGVYSGITQQTDILPSVLSLLHYQGNFSAFGNSIFANNNSFNISYSNGLWQLIYNNNLLQFDGEKTTGFYNLKNDSLLKNNLISTGADYRKDEKILQSVLQQFRTSMLTNSICKP